MIPMNNKSIILIKSNLLDIDPRLQKEFEALNKEGYSIKLLCWDRECSKELTNEKDNRYSEMRLHFKAPYGVRILMYLPIWWLFELYSLIKSDAILIHAINLDSAIPAIIASRIKRVPLIYEIFDVYVDTIILPKLIRDFFVSIERIITQFADAIIIVSEGQIEELRGIPNENTIIINNSPPDIFKNRTNENDKFIIFFAGVLQRSRHLNLKNIFNAVRDLEEVKVIIAGYGDCVDEIKSFASKNQRKIEFIGKISYAEVLEMSQKADLLFALYDPIVPTIKVAGANKLFEAMMSGKPILVSKGTAMADIVEKEDCGLIVDYNDVNDIKKAIILLKENRKLYNHLSENGRKAYLNKYSDSIMKKRLLNLYNEIFQSQLLRQESEI